MKRIILIACCCLALGLVATQAHAVNSVVVESKHFANSAVTCSVGVFLTNDVPITGLTLPLECRQLNGLGYPKGSPGQTTLTATFFGTIAGKRVNASPLGPADAGGLWPAASITSSRFDTISTGTQCSGPTSSSWSGAAAAPSPDGLDAIFYASVSQGDPGIGEEIAMPAGADPAGTANASFLFRFDLNTEDGCFVIDTCCRTPASHLVFVDEQTQAVVPLFTRGEISIGAATCGAPANQPPTAICQNVQVAADGNCQGTVTAAQVNNGSNDPEDLLNVTLTLEPAGPFALGATPVKLIVADTQGLKDTCDATVTVVDQTKPTITCPGPITVQCSADVPGVYADAAAFVAAGGSLSDNCAGVVFSFVGATSNGQTCPEILTRRYVATDGAGLADTCEQTVTIDDTIAPVITQCNNDTTIHIPNGTPNVVVNYSNSILATDNCDPSLTITYDPVSGAVYTPGALQVSAFVTDDCGNADTCTFIVTVIEDPAGNTPPTAVCQNVVANATSTCDASVSAAQVNNGSSDNETAPGNLVLSLVPAGPYPKGVTNVQLIVTDEGGLADTCDATITVNDVTAPVISCPDTVYLYCTQGFSGYDSAGFLAAGGTLSDNCPNYIFTNFGATSENVDQGCVGSGSYKWTYRITDAAGNFAECSHFVMRYDSTAPQISCPTNISTTVSAGTTDTIINYVGATGSDDCDASIDYSYSTPSGSSFPVGVTVVTVIGTDNCGNKDTCEFSVTITEETTGPVPPVAICQNLILDADSNCQASGSVNNGSNDPDGGLVTLDQSPAGPYGLGLTNVTLIVTDDEGEKDTCFATVTVNDVTKPVPTCPGNIVVSTAAGLCSQVVQFAGSATDNCDQNIALDYTPPSGSTFPKGVTTVKMVATDDAGNKDSCSFTVTVEDHEAPVIDCPLVDLNVDNDLDQCGAIVNYDLDVTDNCPGIGEVYTPPSGSFLPVGQTQIRLIATDASGNKDTCFFNVFVHDAQKPTITCPGDIFIMAPEGAAGVNVNFNQPNGTDNCPGLQLSCGANSGDFFPIGVHTVCCFAYDAALNFDSCCFTIQVMPPGVLTPGPRAEPDTLIAKLICGQCDTFKVFVDYIAPNKVAGFPWEFTENLPWLTVAGFDGFAPEDIELIVCPGDLPQGEYTGWFYMHPILTKGTSAPPTDSIFIILEANPSFPSLDIPQDSVHIYYTGSDTDTLCSFFNIVNLTCGEACWSYFPIDPPTWLSIGKTEGTTPDSVDFCVNPCGLEEGIYCVPVTVCPCPTGKADKNIGCDFVWIDLHVINPPAMVVNPTNADFPCLTYGEKHVPIEVSITNVGGGDLYWASWHNQPWLHVEPDFGLAPSTMYLSVNWDSLPRPQECDTLYDTVYVNGNKGCAFFGDQLIEVTLCVCPDSLPLCDSICGWVYDASCYEKSLCGIDSAHVELWSSYPDGVILESTLTSFGAFCFDVTPGQEYDIRIWKKGYCTQVVTDWKCEDGFLNIFLDPLNFVPLPNWPYFTDYFSTNAQFMSGGVPYPIIPGDVIYATDPDGVICGIYWVTEEGTYLIHVLGDDPKTAEDEGAELGDQITLWLNCECPVVAPDTWVNFGDFQFDALWDCESHELCCTLCEGWNMWSYNRVLPDYTRASVLTTIDLNYSAVRSGLCDLGSISWFEGRPVNDLVDVPPTFGYDLLMKQDDTVCIGGKLIDPSTPIYLCAGWNYIPYWPNEMDNLGHALQSLSGNYSHIFTMYCGFGVVSWHEGRPVNDLTCMETCHGYWINMKTDDTLIYPSSGYECGLVAPKLGMNSASGRVVTSPMVADFWSAGGSGLNIGDQLTVRGTSGQMVGECTVGAGGAFLMHVYGDVPTTSEMEGVEHGESLTFEVNGVAASVSGQTHWYDRDNNEITVTPTSGSPVPTEYALLQNYPNPFNAGTVMPFVLKNNSTWTLTVYNVMGQEVHSFEGNDGTGTVRVSWNGTDRNGSTVPSGIYFYRVSTPEWTASKKMTLLK